jgi:nitrite reductase (NO-forming)
MKRYLQHFSGFIIILLTFSACSSGGGKTLRGAEIYTRNCSSCHQADGKGVGNVFPPLHQSDYIQKDPNRLIHNILYGLNGEIEVNGQKFNGLMPPVRLTDEEILSVSNYVLSNFNKLDIVLKKENITEVKANK